MKIIGLTGGIASGKNFVANILAKSGAAIFDADAEVHEILVNDKALIAKLGKLFPQSLVERKGESEEKLAAQKLAQEAKIIQEIDRKILGKIVFADAEKLKILEDIIHPILRKKYDEFLEKSRQENRKILVLNIPLLLEKQGYECDKIISLLIPPSLQKRRFFSRRKNESKQELEKKFKRIVQFQLSNEERKKKSDFVIYTRFSKAKTVEQVKKILQKL